LNAGPGFLGETGKVIHGKRLAKFEINLNMTEIKE
jgi:hypothetical protein